MSGRQIACLNPDGTDGLQVAAVKTDALVQDHIAHGVVLHVAVVAFHHDLFLFALLFGDSLHEVGQNLVEGLVAGLLAHERLGYGIHFVVGFLLDALANLLVVGLVAVLAFREGGGHLGGQLDLSLALYLDGVLGEVEGGNHVVLGNLLHLTFHHHDVLHGGGDNHVDVGFLHVLHGRVDDELAVHTAYAHLRDGALEGDVGHCDGRGGGQTCQTIGQHVLVTGDQGHDDLRLCVKIFREKRADGAVHQSSDEDLILGGAGLTTEETAGDAAEGSVFFLIFYL